MSKRDLNVSPNSLTATGEQTVQTVPVSWDQSDSSAEAGQGNVEDGNRVIRFLFEVLVSDSTNQQRGCVEGPPPAGIIWLM